jgi:hypothetical protein
MRHALVNKTLNQNPVILNLHVFTQTHTPKCTMPCQTQHGDETLLRTPLLELQTPLFEQLHSSQTQTT